MTKPEAFARFGDVLSWLHGEVVESAARSSALRRPVAQGGRFSDGLDRATAEYAIILALQDGLC